MGDLNARIKQLTNLILTSQTVDENHGDESRPASPSKVDFDMTPYQVRDLPIPPFLPEKAPKLIRTKPQTLSSNKNSFPRDARSNPKRRKFLRSKKRSSRGPSCLPMHQRARRIGCLQNKHVISANSRWSSRATRITSVHRCVRCARMSNVNGADDSPRRKRNARKRMNGQRSLHVRSKKRKRLVHSKIKKKALRGKV
jgi:hypothetical protein